ncbi:DUF3857 domain-containing protein [candidate division KSB1 bacterium]|nr:DUF3857 domain-containing protein [candidate division KSB1 bacterium]
MNRLLSLLFLASLGFAQSPEQPVPLKFPLEQSNAIVRFDCTAVHVQPDGHSVTFNHYRTAVLSDRAIAEHAQDVNVYNAGYDTVEVLVARVHLPDGKVVDVDPEQIKDVPMPAFGKFFLHNVREKIVTFPELVEGAEIEMLTKTTTHEPPMDGEFDFSCGLESDNPVARAYVAITLPQERQLHWKTRGTRVVNHRETPGDGTVKHVWEVAQVPQLVPEPGMPPWPEVASMLLATTVPNWERWSTWYDSLAGPTMVADDSIKALVKELTAGKPRDEQLREIFYYVSNRIRYVETAMTGRKAGYKPEAASVTLRNKYGVCRDKAALMVTMLREAGIESEITLMNPSWKIDPEIAVDQFNHAIVAVRDGQHVTYVDPTVEKTKEFLAGNEQDRGVLVCDHDGEPLRWTPIEASEQNLYSIKAESHLDSDAAFHSFVTITTRGLPDLILRNYLQGMPPKQREDLFKRLIQGVSATAELQSLEISDPMDFNTAMELKLAFSAEDYSITAGKYLLFQVPGQSTGLDFLTGYLLGGTDLTERRFDLRLESTFAVRVDETVTFPDGYKVRSLPEKVELDYGQFRLARDFSQKANELNCRRVLDVSTLDVTREDYSKLQALLKKSDAMGRGQVVLVKG